MTDEDKDVVVSTPNSPPSSDHESDIDLLLEDDQALWPEDLNARERYAIFQKRPGQIETDFPKNQDGRRFTCCNYRSWVVHSKSKDSVLCFCWLFWDGNTQLSSNGFNNWKKSSGKPQATREVHPPRHKHGYLAYAE